ncbi:hypothetical protein LMIY3S_01192 [Labrys miyagiensis]
MTLKRLLLIPLQIVVGFIVVIDELARPIYRPLIRRFAELHVVEAAEAAVARLPRFVILVLLLVPLAIAEPLKIYGLLQIGQGHLVRGVLILALAYLASFLLIERIYDAGKSKLMTISWFAWVINFIAWIRAAILDWLKATPVWGAIAATKALVARAVAAVRTAR